MYMCGNVSCVFCAVNGGWVRYSIKGLIKRSGLSRNLRTKMLFTVLDVLDLNLTANPRVRFFTLSVTCCKSAELLNYYHLALFIFISGYIVVF